MSLFPKLMYIFSVLNAKKIKKLHLKNWARIRLEVKGLKII